jgi:hypothetical protein
LHKGQRKVHPRALEADPGALDPNTIPFLRIILGPWRLILKPWRLILEPWRLILEPWRLILLDVNSPLRLGGLDNE